MLEQLQWITPEDLITLCSRDRTQRRRLLRLSEQTARDSHADWPSRKKRERRAGLPGRKGSEAGSAAEDGQAAARYWRDLLQMACGMMSDQMADGIRRGMALAGFEQSISAAEENETDYRKLLRKYARMKEQKMEDFDSFDYSWYSLGMELYGNIPLIEFPESTEKPAVDEIVIGVDVSGSCGGDVAARFLRETCNMIRDIGVGTEETDLRIIECDMAIQRETVIRRKEDIPDFEARIVRGFGGTSFVPVFQRIHKLREQGELRGPRCLLYLSDGFGAFPEAPPPYDVIFVLTVQSLLTREEMEAILSGAQERSVMNKLRDFSFQERWAVLMCLMALLERRIGAVLDKIRAHDKWYRQLQEKAAPEEKEAFRRTTAALDGELDEARAQVDNTLSLIQTVFGEGREAEILIGRMLENERFQEFSAHRRMEKLIELYEVLTARQGEAMKRIQGWAGAQPAESQEPPVSRIMSCS